MDLLRGQTPHSQVPISEELFMVFITGPRTCLLPLLPLDFKTCSAGTLLPMTGYPLYLHIRGPYEPDSFGFAREIPELLESSGDRVCWAGEWGEPARGAIAYVLISRLHVTRQKVGRWVEINDSENNCVNSEGPIAIISKLCRGWKSSTSKDKLDGTHAVSWESLFNTSYFLGITESWDGKSKDFEHQHPSLYQRGHMSGILDYLWV